MTDKPFITIHRHPDSEQVSAVIVKEHVAGMSPAELLNNVNAAQRAMAAMYDDLIQAHDELRD